MARIRWQAQGACSAGLHGKAGLIGCQAVQLQACRLQLDSGVDIACCVLEFVDLSSFNHHVTYLWSETGHRQGACSSVGRRCRPAGCLCLQCA